MTAKFMWVFLLLMGPLLGVTAPYNRSIDSSVFQTCEDRSRALITLNDGTTWSYEFYFSDEALDDVKSVLNEKFKVSISPVKNYHKYTLATPHFSLRVACTSSTIAMLPKIAEINFRPIKSWFQADSFACTIVLSDGAIFEYVNCVNIRPFLDIWKVGQPILAISEIKEKKGLHYTLINMDLWFYDHSYLTNDCFNSELNYNDKGTLKMLKPPTQNSNEAN